jgi:sigma-B regulation protein RsbU (phosphoserine phosphatase)
MTQILVIDDDPTIRVVLTRALKKQGYGVTVAENGQEGIDRAKEIHPALIICDWMMPIMDGLEVCRQVKANPDLSTTFFILLTSRGGTEDRVMGLDTGADEFLSKPIRPDELSARVRAGLRIYQLTSDLRSSNQRLADFNHILEAQLAEGAEYVRSQLPPPMKTDPVTINNRFIPSRQLGGDCFDYYWLDDEHLVMYLLDVSGHGLGSTLPSVAVSHLLRTRSLSGVPFSEPARVLSALNDAFQMDMHQDKYFTIWYGVYHVPTRELSYSCAGHPPAILLSGDPNTAQPVQKLKTPGMPVGMFPEIEYPQNSFQVPPLSTLYIYSDGAYEINQRNGKLWTLEEFVQLLSDYREKNQTELDQLLDYLRNLNPKRVFEDDLSLLQVNFL